VGEMADYYNEQQMDNVEALYDYRLGHMTLDDAMELAVLDEYGDEPDIDISLVEVHDRKSMIGVLDKCELALYKLLDRRHKKKYPERSYWISGGKKMYPEEMETSHLKNAIAYAKRFGIIGDIVEEMKKELKCRMTAN
jgi:hypothetical protein